MIFRRFSRPRKFSRRPRRAIRRRSKVSKKIKSFVKRAIHRNIENKEIITYAANQGCLAWATGVAGRSIALLPPIQQGTGNSQRIGNQVKIVSGIIKGQVNLLPYDATTNPAPTPVWVKIYMVRLLYTQAQDPTLATAYTDNFFRGVNSAYPFQSNVLDMDLPINDDWFRVLATKTFKLGAASATALGAVTTTGYYDNSPMCKKFTFNWSKWARKVLKFNDNVLNYYPQNDNIYLVFQPMYADGRVTNPYTPVEMHYVNHVKYEDA